MFSNHEARCAAGLAVIVTGLASMLACAVSSH
jgi:hypothetical protein